jgi:hypothetical protein
VLAAGARCQLYVKPKATAPGARTAQLFVTDNSGAKTTTALTVNAEPLLRKDSVTMVSESGDFVGQGTDRLFDSPPGSVYLRGGLSHVEVSASGEPGEFSFDFAPPAGMQLEVGEYAGAQRYPFEPAGVPGLSVSGDARGCNNDYGRFIVRDVHVDNSGKVDRFWALYEQHCEAPGAPALFGEVRVGEPTPSAPEVAQPAAIDWPDTLVSQRGVPVPVTVIAGEAGAHVTAVRVEGADPGDFSVTSDGCEGAVLGEGARCQLAVGVKPSASGTRTAALTITDASGAVTTIALEVHAEPFVAPSPSVTTELASGITTDASIVNASVNPNGGEVTDCHFDYGTTLVYGASVPCTTQPGSGTSPVVVSASLSALDASTTYHFRIVATNSGGTSAGSDHTFKTLPPPPLVQTGQYLSGASTLTAAVNPEGGEVTDCHFELGTTNLYGQTVPCAAAPGSGAKAVEVSARLASLLSGASYHFRIVAVNAGGMSYGSDVEFRTSPLAPVVPIYLSQASPLPSNPQLLAIPDAELASTALVMAPSGIVYVLVSCPAGEASCAGTVALRTLSAVTSQAVARTTRPSAAVLVLASGSFKVAGGSTARVKLRLSARARRLLLRRHVLHAQAITVAHDSAGATHTSKVGVTIRLAKRPPRA